MYCLTPHCHWHEWENVEKSLEDSHVTSASLIFAVMVTMGISVLVTVMVTVRVAVMVSVMLFVMVAARVAFTVFVVLSGSNCLTRDELFPDSMT
jgi:hypothetical protein